MTRYRAVVIGLGRIGFKLEGDYGRAKPCTHAGAYQRSRRVELVGGYDIDLEQSQKFRATYPKCVVNKKNEKLNLNPNSAWGRHKNNLRCKKIF